MFKTKIMANWEKLNAEFKAVIDNITEEEFESWYIMMTARKKAREFEKNRPKCENGYLDTGQCCCNCIHQNKLHKHPANKDIGKGSISEQMGYVCSYPLKENTSIFFDHEHGMCEMHHYDNKIENKK